MTAAVRAVPRKRRRIGPAPEAQLGRRIISAQPTIEVDDAPSSWLSRLAAALTPETDQEKTLLLGLGLLGLGLLFSPLPWLALVIPGGVLSWVAAAPRRLE